jgi:hypothetical protein
MGGSSVNYLNLIAILLIAYLAIFVEAYSTFPRAWIGAQVDVLPVLMVYCGLSTGLATLSVTAVVAGVWFDSLSANPLGISILPQFCVGVAVYWLRELVLREELYARFVLGFCGAAAAPFLTVLLLWGSGQRPLIGWGSLWQWLVLAVGGGLLTPVCFWCFDRLNAALAYGRTSESTFRPDREIKRGRR